MRSGVIISIREKSTRFPGKVLKMIGEQTVTEHLIDRMKMTQKSDIVVIATSDDHRDAVFQPFAEKKGIKVFFGNPEDKLARYLQVALQYRLDAMAIVDGDDILCFPEIVDETIELFKSSSFDAIFWEGLPLGAACSGLRTSALMKIMQLKEESDTEVWGGYFTNSHFNVLRAKSEIDLFNQPDIRLTLDYQEDYLLFKEIFAQLLKHGNSFSSKDLMKLLVVDKPELKSINRAVQAMYEENLKKSAPVKMRSNQ